MGLLLKIKPSSLTILPLGVSILFHTNCEDYNKKIKKGNILSIKKFFVALAGPLTNMILALFLFFISKWLPHVLVWKIIYANILLCLFNILPIYPLDGGRMLKNVLHIYLGLQKANAYSYFVSNFCMVTLTVLSSFLVLFAKNIAIFLIIIYLWILVLEQNKAYHLKEKILQNVQKSLLEK